MTRYRAGTSRSLSPALFARSRAISIATNERHLLATCLYEETNMRARISRTNGDLGLVLGLWLALIETVGFS